MGKLGSKKKKTQNYIYMPQNLSSNEPPPFSVEAERAGLGGSMLKNDAWELVAGVVLEEDF